MTIIPMDRRCLAYLIEHGGCVPLASIPSRLFVGDIPIGTANMIDLGFIEEIDGCAVITELGRAAVAS